MARRLGKLAANLRANRTFFYLGRSVTISEHFQQAAGVCRPAFLREPLSGW
jgi:hypothetical protein